jgi:hypothetical protein
MFRRCATEASQSANWITALDGDLQLLISTPLKLELERILRDKFSYSPREIVATAAFLWRGAEWIVPRRHLDLCPDETDNRVLE